MQTNKLKAKRKTLFTIVPWSRQASHRHDMTRFILKGFVIPRLFCCISLPHFCSPTHDKFTSPFVGFLSVLYIFWAQYLRTSVGGITDAHRWAPDATLRLSSRTRYDLAAARPPKLSWSPCCSSTSPINDLDVFVFAKLELYNSEFGLVELCVSLVTKSAQIVS
jgi:hypothetical protein